MATSHFRPSLSLSFRDLLLAVAICLCAYTASASADNPVNDTVSSSTTTSDSSR